MTTAAVVATAATEDGRPAALLEAGGSTLVVRLLRQLRAQRVGKANVVTRNEWVADIAAALKSVHDVSVRGIDDTAELPALLGGLAPAGADLVVADSAVVAHDAVVWRALLQRGAVAIASVTGDPVLVRRPVEVLAQTPPPDDLAAVVAGAAAGLTPLPLDGLIVEQPRSAGAAVEAVARVRATDERQVLLRAAVKSDDGFFTTFFVTPWVKHVSAAAARGGVSPNAATAMSLLLAALAAAAFATGVRAGAIAGAVLLLVSFAADVVDGQVARYARRFSATGAWLDATVDRVKEYLVFAGLAFGAARTGDPQVWVLAAAALTLQVVRHTLLFSYAAAAGAGGSGERREVAADAPAARTSVATWLRRSVILPIGERVAVVCLAASFGSPRLVFTVLLSWGAVALAYTLAGRVARSLSGDARPAGGDAVRVHRDDGPIARLLRPRPAGSSGMALAWLVPPLLRAVEYATIVVLAVRTGAGAPVAAFALLGAVAYHHYDVDHRLRLRGAAPPAWVCAAGFGWEGRLLLVGLASAAGAFVPLVVGLAVWCAILFVGESVRVQPTAAAQRLR